MRPCDLAPDHADLGATDLLLATVDIGDLLAKVEVGGGGVIDALDLDQACLGVGDVATTLIAQVASLDVKSVSGFGRHLDREMGFRLINSSSNSAICLQDCC